MSVADIRVNVNRVDINSDIGLRKEGESKNEPTG
jgi:hypothetical protein